jgi:hypothetical protein
MGPLAAGLLAGGSILSGLSAARASSRATDASVDASRAGIAEQRRQFDRTTQLNEPFRQAGIAGLNAFRTFIDAQGGRNQRYGAQERGLTNRLGNQLGGALDMFSGTSRALNDRLGRQVTGAERAFTSNTGRLVDATNRRVDSAQDRLERDLAGARAGYDEIMAREFEADPGFQFIRAENERAINRGASARGNALGGATMQALLGRGNDLASLHFGEFDARRNRDAVQSFGMDSGIAGTNFDTEVGAAESGFGRSYGRQGDVANMRIGNAGTMFNADMGRQNAMLAGRTGNAAAMYDAGMGRIANNYNRDMGRGNAFANLAGLGEAATNTAINAGSNMAANVGNLYGQIGQARADGAVGMNNALQGVVSNGFGILGAGANGMFSDGNMDWLTNMFRPGGVNTGGLVNGVMSGASQGYQRAFV